ncbi:MAG: discoidin domain-containing protein [Candidatus Omnitrophota bacterium]|nr:MAG: discoidin domain-containing protein [Candidatus Omnitrophota bacterium]
MKRPKSNQIKGGIKMKVMFRITMVFFLAMLLLPICPAEATWEVVDDFTSLDHCGKMLDADGCDFRFKYVDKQHQASDIVFELFFNVDVVQKTIHPSTGEVYSQQFSANIGYEHLGRLMFGGALSRDAYDTIKDLFRNSPKNPWGLKITHIHNSSINQLSLSYYYLNDSGQTYSRTIRLSEENFTLEAQCQEVPLIEIPNIIASASSQYSSSYGPEKTVDGNNSTYWIGGRSEPDYTLDYDLGGTYKLEELAITWYSAYYSSSDFDVLISENGATYSEVQTGLNNVSSIDLKGNSASHIRIAIFGLNNAYFPVIKEVVVTGRE